MATRFRCLDFVSVELRPRTGVGGSRTGTGGKKVEATLDGQTVRLLADLPDYVHSHCMVTLSGGDMFYSGGKGQNRTKYKESYRYVTHENKWVRKEDMLVQRHGHACGRVTGSTGWQFERIIWPDIRPQYRPNTGPKCHLKMMQL